MTLELIVLGSYYGVLCLLAILGLHRLALVGLYLRYRSRAPRCPAPPLVWPTVTVQLPVFNEAHVVERLLGAVAALDYPPELLEIQVLDDSDDVTTNRVAERVAALRARGLQVQHLHRRERLGYKAGALAAGLEQSRGELVCVFDADFVPPPGFLRATVPFFADRTVGMVQVRWGHLNRRHSLLTRLQAMFLDAHFAVEQAARNWSGRFFNFNGTAGVWRRATIDDAGGWQHDTLTEDLDLSYRAQLRGWSFVYAAEPAAPAELPVSVAAFQQQQQRWTRGAVQTSRKLLGSLWRSEAPLAVKVEGTFHMTANVAYPLMVMLSVLVFPAMWLRRADGATDLMWLDRVVLGCATGSVCVFFLLAQREVGRSWLVAVLRLPALMALGAGISLGNTCAVLAGLRRSPGAFARTPKYAVAPGESWRHLSYRASSGSLPLLEGAFALYLSLALAVALTEGMWFCVPVLLLFQAGYSYVAILSLAQRPVAPVAVARPGVA